jgi:hypothetical protein
MSTQAQPFPITCSDCGQPLEDSQPKTPCPKCGSTRRTHHADLHLQVKASASIAWESAKWHWERHPLYLALTFILVVGAPFLGLWVSGWLGVVIGLLISIVCFVVGLKALTRVKEIERG